MTYRLGLDIGANSIGWCAVMLSGEGLPCGLLDLGVRIYPDGRNPKDQTSLAAARRAPRAMRRNRDRYLQRRRALLNALTRAGLMPEAETERQRVARLDPYALRADALRRKLAPEELGRVLFHLNQHRGFKSNRRIDKGSNEGGLIRDAAKETEAILHRTGHPTIGSWLAERHGAHLGVRVRLAGSGKSANYPFYPLRQMIEAEFDTVWVAQSGWNPALTADMGTNFRHIIFHQRDLRPPVVGKCWLEPKADRGARALPTAQRFRIAQTLTHLRLSPPGEPQRPLSDKERELLRTLLYRGTDQTFDAIRKKLRLDAETDFNSRDDKLTGCATAARLGKGSGGATWHELPLSVQDAAVRIVLESEADESARAGLEALGLGADMAERLMKATLPDGHAALSAEAMGRILPFMESGQSYDQAVQSAGYAHHSDRRTGEIRELLPYYGEVLCQRIGTGSGRADDIDEKRFGRAPNPTVHVALNEIRRVVNAIIKRHGAPAEIVVETLRELGRSAQQRKDYEAEQKKNRTANDDRRAELAGFGEVVNGAKLMRLRLLGEQASDPKNRVCPYTGTVITPRKALSDEIEEDHILPFSACLDDSAANRILVTREANRIKGKRTPFEAFGHTADWPAILERAALLPGNKRWRFQPDAMDRLAQNGDFLARHLTDSATIARWAVEYLAIVAPERVRAVPGRLTALLRHALGLNSRSVLGKGGARKDRRDHRHHAIDAVVVAMTDRGMLQRVTRAAKSAEATGERLTLKVDLPWDSFVADVSERLKAVIVSHKPDTGWQGALHKETAYGLIADISPGEHNVVVRKPLETVTTWSDEKIRSSVRDLALAGKIAAAVEDKDVTARRAALAALRHSGGHVVRRVRITKVLPVRTIADRRSGLTYKGVELGSNHRFEIWRLPGGTLTTNLVPIFDAAQGARRAKSVRGSLKPRPHPAAKLIMRLHKADMIAFGNGDGRRIFRVAMMRDGRIVLSSHEESGNLESRNLDPTDPFKYFSASLTRLVAERARKVFVAPDGKVFDPGPVL